MRQQHDTVDNHVREDVLGSKGRPFVVTEVWQIRLQLKHKECRMRQPPTKLPTRTHITRKMAAMARIA